MRWSRAAALLGALAWSGAVAQDRPPPPGTPEPPAAGFGAPPAAAPSPAHEPEAVRSLRALLGPDVGLRYAAAEVIDPARGTVRLRDVLLGQPEAQARIGELTLEGLREDGVGEAVARNLVLPAPDGGIRMDQLRLAGFAVRRPVAGEALRPDMVSADGLRIEGLSAAGDIPVAIALLDIESYGAGRAGRATLEGVEIGLGDSLPVDRVSLRRVSLRGLDLATTLAALTEEEAPPQPGGAYALEAEDLALGREGRPVGGLDSLHLGGEVAPDGIETGRLALRGIRVEPFPGLAEWLQRFGYTALTADLTAETRYDRAAGGVEVTSLSLAGRDIGAIGLSLALDGATPEAVEAQDLEAMRLTGLSLRYVDQSLYDRFVREQARQMRRTEQEVRRELAGIAGSVLGGPAGDGAAMAPVRDAVRRFLLGQARELEIRARPPEPLPLSLLGGTMALGPAEAQRLLGLGASAR